MKHFKPMRSVATIHLKSGDTLHELHVYRDRCDALHFELMQPYRDQRHAYAWRYFCTIPADGRSALVPYGARRLNHDAPQSLRSVAGKLREMRDHVPRVDPYTGHYTRPPVVVVHGTL